VEAPEPDETPTPFSFKLMVVLLVIYLAYRIAQLVACIPAWVGGADCPFV
jgi:hypothetical protein